MVLTNRRPWLNVASSGWYFPWQMVQDSLKPLHARVTMLIQLSLITRRLLFQIINVTGSFKEFDPSQKVSPFNQHSYYYEARTDLIKTYGCGVNALHPSCSHAINETKSRYLSWDNYSPTSFPVANSRCWTGVLRPMNLEVDNPPGGLPVKTADLENQVSFNRRKNMVSFTRFYLFQFDFPLFSNYLVQAYDFPMILFITLVFKRLLVKPWT